MVIMVLLCHCYLHAGSVTLAQGDVALICMVKFKCHCHLHWTNRQVVSYQYASTAALKVMSSDNNMQGQSQISLSLTWTILAWRADTATLVVMFCHINKMLYTSHQLSFIGLNFSEKFTECIKAIMKNTLFCRGILQELGRGKSQVWWKMASTPQTGRIFCLFIKILSIICRLRW